MHAQGDVDRLAAAVLETAQRALDREEWDEAAHLAKEVLVILPDHAGATAVLAAAEAGRNERTADEGRRYLTVLFSDLVGSTPLSEQLDPEDYLLVINRYRDVVRAALHRHGGSIDQFQGDGVVAYFGLPVADEHDQLNACEAGLEIVRATAQAGRVLGLELAARVAVHVGRTVLTGVVGTRDQSAAVSFAANVAARIQGHARPGSVVVSETAADAVATSFELRPLEPVALKGVSEPMRLFEVQAPRARTTGGDARLVQPLVDRAAERGALDAAMSAATGPGGGDASPLVLLVGEPGIGKSRLVRHATDRAVAEGMGLIEINCGRSLAHVGLGALRGALEKALDLGPHPTPAGTRAALAARGAALRLPAPAVEVLQSVLAHTPGSTSLPEMAPDRLRESIIQALLDWVGAEAASAPLALVVEDLHWADDTLLEIIRRLTSRPLPAGLFAILTCRAGQLPTSLVPLQRAAIEVGPLGDDDAADLVRVLAGDRHLDPEAVEALRRRGEGVPLFTEHLVLAATATGEPPVHEDALPGTLEGVLQTRISASGPARAVAEVASVVGREFSVELLQQTLTILGDRAPCRPERVPAALERLERAGLVEPLDFGRARFRHSLVRDVAYEMQLRRVRPHRHRAVAQASLAMQGADASPAMLAYHHERAGEPEAAAADHLRAAEQAAQLAEFDQAIHHLRAAAALLAPLDTPTARRLELAQCMQLGGVAAASFSFARDEATEAYERALGLCDLIAAQDGADEHLDIQLVGALGGLWAKEVVAGDMPAARAVTDRLEHLLGRASFGNEPEVSHFVHGCRGLELLYTGDTAGAIKALVDGASPEAPRPMSVSLGTPHDSVAAAGGVLAVARTLAGDDAGADLALAGAVERARQIPFPVGPFSEAVVAVYAAYLHRLRGDLDAAREAADMVGAVGDRHGFQEHAMLGQMLTLAANALGGDPGSCQALEATLSMWRMTGGGLAMPALLAELGEGYLRAGDLEGAHRAVADGMAMLEPTEQRAAEPALERVAALAGAAEGRREEAVHRLVAAAELALRQGSPRLAARAVYDLLEVAPGDEMPAAAVPVARQTVAAIPDGANAELREIAGWIRASV